MKTNIVASYNRKIYSTFISNLTYKTITKMFIFTYNMFNRAEQCKYKAKIWIKQIILVQKYANKKNPAGDIQRMIVLCIFRNRNAIIEGKRA